MISRFNLFSGSFFVVAALAFGFLSCSSSGPIEEYEPIDFETFIDGKEDTGYLSNKAAEMEARLISKVYIDMTGQSAQAIQAKADSLQSASRWTLQKYTSPQLKYARNPLKGEKLDLNLERGDPEVVDVTTDANGVWLQYASSIESLVKFKELEEMNLTPSDLIGKQIAFQLPSMPESVFGKGGIACASDPDGDELHVEDLNDSNYFYYFDPDKQGCALVANVDLVSANYEIISSLDTPSVYPEYDLLTQDKKISMVNLFGQITHGDLEDNDWGWIAYEQFKREFERAGFSVAETFENNFGHRLTKTYTGGLEVTANFYTPEALKDHRPREEVNQLFSQAIHDHEIVYYNGHAFYGSLTVLDKPESYPEETYQIINMDACWSYAYYTKQVFENKVDAETDPDGMKYADVVNNTEPGITGSHKTAWLLYKNIFKGASDYMQGRSLSKYSWNNLIVYMNNSADQRARWYDPEKFHAEIYGASGVGSNCFNPSGPSYCEDNGGSSLTHEYEDTSETEIPDNNDGGISRTINVTDQFTVKSVSLEVDIKHTYIGDLKVTLTHAGSEQVLHNKSGGGSDDIRTTFAVSGFENGDSSGDWIISVSDHASYDTGRLVSWKLILNESSSDPNLIEGENTGSVYIPDDDSSGASSSIDISAGGTVSEIMVRVDISHTYIGDLVVTLAHDGSTVTLHDKAGGGTENLALDQTLADFSGQSASGQWTLKVVDTAAADTGTLNSWFLTIVPAQ
ncbi:MAG: proprotein convertase P-domain-containing protein [Deltaproteobacteria bacterium]|nr:proprotein convertase P-domain-containing protein [Deltaproteobacteria bacterium]